MSEHQFVCLDTFKRAMTYDIELLYTVLCAYGTVSDIQSPLRLFGVVFFFMYFIPICIKSLFFRAPRAFDSNTFPPVHRFFASLLAPIDYKNITCKSFGGEGRVNRQRSLFFVYFFFFFPGGLHCITSVRLLGTVPPAKTFIIIAVQRYSTVD